MKDFGHGDLLGWRRLRARNYVKRDRSRADDYYLGEGTGVAERLAATPDGVTHAGKMTGDADEQWVAGINVETDAKKGRLLRFVEVTVNGPIESRSPTEWSARQPPAAYTRALICR